MFAPSDVESTHDIGALERPPPLQRALELPHLIHRVLTHIDEQRIPQRTIHGTAESDLEHVPLPDGCERVESSRSNDC